jgi:hypothetical protein
MSVFEVRVLTMLAWMSVELAIIIILVARLKQ